MVEYLTKKQLYDKIHTYKGGLGLDVNDYGFDMISLCKEDGVKLEKLPFKTKALRGMASIGISPSDDVILLNADRDDKEQNFDCSHEYVHLCIHRNLDKKIFNCIDAIYAKQDSTIEWQANEGAAELLVPYKAFLPLVKNEYPTSDNPVEIISLKDYLADIFNVTTKVITYRLESLKYEVHQYLNGASLQDVKIMSLAQQKRNKIDIRSLNDIENEYFNSLVEQWHDVRQTQKQVYLQETKFINFETAF
jgi:Zn-dependent peptidase ImmA (M78 family)